MAGHSNLHGYLHTILVRHPCHFAICPDPTRSITIPRRNARRNSEPQPINFGIMLKLHDILDLNLDRLSSTDVPKVRTEHIGSRLFQQTSSLTAFHSFLVLDLRFFLLLYYALDDALADMTSKRCDCAGFVEREGVFGFGD